MKKLLATQALAMMAWLLTLTGAVWMTPTSAAQGKAPTVTSLFKIEGMTCGGCEAGVRMKVKRLDGVEQVVASYKEKSARVTYNPKVVTPVRIIEAIQELGYSAKLVSEKKAGGEKSVRRP